MYLRMCLAYNAGALPTVESTAAMQEQAPALSAFVHQLIADGSETGPIVVYLDIIRQLLTALNGQ